MRACGKGAITRLTFATIFCTQKSQRTQGKNFAAKGLRFAQRQSQPDAMTWQATGAAKRAAFLQPIGTPPE
jgi:hypothetical protein